MARERSEWQNYVIVRRTPVAPERWPARSRIHGMGTEAFYATAAQVLPTLLIALSVEIAFVMQARFREVEELHRSAQEDEEPTYRRRLNALSDSVVGWFRAAVVLAGAFLFGELLAFLALGFRWFTVVAFVGVALSVVTMSVAVLVVPLRRFIDVEMDN
ncbi:hypothetical protein ACU635_59880 [[Actinomadura] parvosata]|uniref:hypothetical protein n=1 Tax=[Actinomadura] parvosata TaxID=1955412 RepID=UPI00406C2DC9